MTSEKLLWRAFRAAMGRAAAWPFRVAGARATLRTLANMDRRELADIGLSRSDLRDVSALALDCDPTALLARRARDRRRDAFGRPPPPWVVDPPIADPAYKEQPAVVVGIRWANAAQARL